MEQAKSQKAAAAALATQLRAEMQRCEAACKQLTQRVEKEAAEIVALAKDEANRLRQLASRHEASSAQATKKLRVFRITKKRAVASGRWDFKRKLRNMLNAEDEKAVSKRYVHSRIFNSALGEYTELTNKYNPKTVIKRGVSLNMNASLLQDIYHWWLDEDSKAPHLQHRTTLSAIINARSKITFKTLHLESEDDSVAPFGVIIDAPARNNENHTQGGVITM